eukprot:CAMPEP_0184487962 /NCGR_PEP_ID=MMETSP0113_2-20130426/10439_1 /TAXON_ID=91329 /ORGANISM="Norrisiella sphaerica, Strain BC52" /LENGTH=447 /DNA_ID=CAMNT_0026870405 /DNA_START=1 /DNA_END=1344 /DNA_ORIENTATION=-
MGMMTRLGMSNALLLLWLSAASALVVDLNTEHDGRSVFHITSFGYEENGVFQMELKDFVLLVPSSHHNEYTEEKTKNKLVFVLQHSGSGGVRIEEGTSEVCFHETQENVSQNDEIISLPFEVIADKKEFTWKSKISEPGSYHLYFSNCLPGTKIGFKVELTQYNLFHGTKVFLPAGKASLPIIYGTLCLAFVSSFVFWCMYLCKNHLYVVTIHLLMGVVALFKAFTLFSEAFEYHWLKTTGKPHGWNIAFYIFSFLKGMLLFTVIVLIGTGWSYLKPYLTERDKQVMLVVIVVQAMVNVAMVMLDETAPGAIGWLTWRDLLHLLDMLCCCAILLPIVWSIRHLTQASERDGKAARDAERLKQFRKFYMVVVAYIYVTRVVVFLLDATLPFEYTWLANVFSECTSLLFYVGTGWLFRPRGRNPYLVVGGEDDDNEEMDIEPVPMADNK